MALSVQQVLRDRFSIEATVKEPNDVLIGGLKVCGILGEAATTGNNPRLDHLILGVGINISTRFPQELRGIATSLAAQIEAHRLPSAPRLLAWLAQAFESRYRAT